MRQAVCLALLACASALAGCAGAPDPSPPAAVGPTGAAAALPVEAPDAADPPAAVPWSQDGESAADHLAVCVPAGPEGCPGYHGARSGGFALLRPLQDGRIEARWAADKPTERELSVTVFRDEHFQKAASGPSPLSFDLGDLTSGSYSVSVFFTGPVGAMVDQSVSWTVRGNQSAA